MMIFAILAAVAVVASVIAIARDDYHRIPTRRP
jgi:hypothetical protein